VTVADSAGSPLALTDHALCGVTVADCAGSPLALTDHALSGMCAGAVVSFVAAPTELVKCRLQHQGSYESALTRWHSWDGGGRLGLQPTLYKGPWDTISRIYCHEGGVRGCFTGLGATLLREVPGNGIMFAVYEGLKMELARGKV
jgi:solute carrier family 25 carnitine/acylcarnitine transporter 20/29